MRGRGGGLIREEGFRAGGLFERGTLIEDLRNEILNDHTAPSLRNSFVRRNVDQVNYRLRNRATQSHTS